MTGLRSVIIVSSPVMCAGEAQLSLESESERSGLGASAAHLELESWFELTAGPGPVTSSSLELSKTVDLATDHVGRTGRAGLSGVLVETTVCSLQTVGTVNSGVSFCP